MFGGCYTFPLLEVLFDCVYFIQYHIIIRVVLSFISLAHGLVVKVFASQSVDPGFDSLV